jgi:hypothetical protein
MIDNFRREKRRVIHLLVVISTKEVLFVKRKVHDV